MSYGKSSIYGRAQAGDPFLGGLLKGVGKVAGAILPGPVGGAIRAVTGVIGGGGRKAAPAMPGGALPIGPVGARGTPRYAGAGGKRKRMNYSNQKALRRSLRRVTGYARQQKAIKKAASEFAREFGPKRTSRRRDLGAGHTHVR